MLETIAVSGFRNVESAELALGRGLNLLVGGNGAGKTSLLEAVHCLGRARSFLPGSLDGLISRGSSGWWVRGRIAAGEETHQLGVGRSGGRTQVRLDGESVGRLSDVAGLLPIQVLNTRSQRLLSDGPSERRAFLNWGVFHVEQAYADYWRRYERSLRQRNAALRDGDGRLAASWEPEMIASGLRVDRARTAFLDALWPFWQRYVGDWLGQDWLSWSYRRGWASDSSLEDQLAGKRDRELTLGYSLSGPHRADLRILAGGRAASNELSRGQQKLVVAALRFGFIALLAKQASAGLPLLLVDDLPSELDAQNQRAIVEASVSVGAQVLVTAIERKGIHLGDMPADNVFHVEQGKVRNLL